MLDKRILGLVMKNQEHFVVADPHMADCPIIFASRGFCSLTGYVLKDLLGKNCRLLQGKDTNRSTVSQIAAAVANCKEIHVILLNYCKSGAPFWNLLHLSPVLDIDQRLVSFVGSQVNVSAAVGLQKQQTPSPAEATNAIIKRSRNLNTPANSTTEMSAPVAPQQMSQQMSTHQQMSQFMSANQQMCPQMNTSQRTVQQMNTSQYHRSVRGDTTEPTEFPPSEPPAVEEIKLARPYLANEGW
jgi:PAS domain S-box-containing protein